MKPNLECTVAGIPATVVADLRERLDQAVLSRLKGCGELAPFSDAWNMAIIEGHISVGTIQQEWIRHIVNEPNPWPALRREEIKSQWRVAQRLALSA